MFNPVITATAGWSPAVEERAGRLLGYRLGEREGGAPVTVAAAFAGAGRQPQEAARLLMHLPPLDAVEVLTETLAALRIDGVPCPAPAVMARSALAHAGRAVCVRDIHPERVVLAKLLNALLTPLAAALRGLRRPSR